jgi:arylsulfatase A-like enzyme
MMTSRYTLQTGVTGNGMHLDDRLSLLAEALANAGYRTAAVVANPVLSAASGYDQGFETFVEMWRPGASQDAENVTAEATNWLKQMGGERPFFLWVHYIDPHTPYRPPPPYHEMFVGDAYYDASWTVELGPDWKDDLGTIPRIAHLGSRREVDYYIAEYDAEIRYSDLHIGALLDTIGAMNLLDESLMVFAADHGESLGDHNYFFEHGRFPYDATVRVPLLVRWPRHGGAGRVVETPVSLLDVVPTILDVASLPPLIDAAGTSLLPLIRGDADGRAPPVFTEAGYAGGRMYSVRNRRHKLIHVPKPAQQETMQGTPFELYDVIADPNERENLVGVDVETTRQMAKVMLEWLTHSNVSQGQNAKKVEPDLQTREAMRALGYIHD